uniref:Ovule protein n=1 Tax=Steinernema glaseri TaxID=37863 RepID=A0A1I7YI75_9BILA
MEVKSNMNNTSFLRCQRGTRSHRKQDASSPLNRKTKASTDPISRVADIRSFSSSLGIRKIWMDNRKDSQNKQKSKEKTNLMHQP